MVRNGAHVAPECCSRWGRNGAHNEPEWVLTMGRNTQITANKSILVRLEFFIKLVEYFGLISLPHILNKLGFNPFIFSSYSQVVAELYEHLDSYFRSFFSTLTIGGLSVLLSIVFGVTFGVLAAFISARFGYYFETAVKLIWSIPLIAFAVFLHLFIRSDQLFVVITGVFLGVFPVLSYSYRKSIEQHDGIQSLVASFNLGRVAEFRFFRLPEVLRSLVVPLAQSVPLTFIGVTMGEYTVGGVAGSDYVGLGSDFKFGMDHSIFPKVYISISLMMFLIFFSGELFEFLSSVRVMRGGKGSVRRAWIKKFLSGSAPGPVQGTAEAKD